jgi:hypothetical protein
MTSRSTTTILYDLNAMGGIAVQIDDGFETSLQRECL